MRNRLLAMPWILMILTVSAVLIWSHWGLSRTMVYDSGYRFTRIGALQWREIHEPPHDSSLIRVMTNEPRLIASIALTILLSTLTLHATLQVWRNRGPRDQCCHCGLKIKQDDEGQLCPRCWSCPNTHGSPWAFWRLFATQASPLWRWSAAFSIWSVRGASHLVLDNRFARRRHEKLELKQICPGCKYDLHRNTSPICPECGYSRKFMARS